jgi:8-hydroxy-5-deazaflavin:NADPH oxidoreductase
MLATSVAVVRRCSRRLYLATSIRFDAVSAGPLQNAQWLEGLGYLNIQLGYVVGHGTSTGFCYIH